VPTSATTEEEALKLPPPVGDVGDFLVIREDCIIFWGAEDDVIYSDDPEYRKRMKKMDKHLAYHSTNQEGTSIVTPAADMPFWASRMVLRVTKIGVQRIQKMTVEEYVKAGFASARTESGVVHEAWFKAEWDRLWGKEHRWSRNPIAWVLDVEKAELPGSLGNDE
jgi:hypothetical protein